ncbi:hypothetical protein Prudu_020993 [Prunus dulcis]|uniref:Uncharacterized protein n=1 Tax=Prunus dulcis TaxID=3755 RepID=A0A4Y1RXL9_PRUDU|nr:hypothetical protein Prudu_020993 [Prunus dulcis]
MEVLFCGSDEFKFGEPDPLCIGHVVPFKIIFHSRYPINKDSRIPATIEVRGSRLGMTGDLKIQVAVDDVMFVGSGWDNGIRERRNHRMLGIMEFRWIGKETSLERRVHELERTADVEDGSRVTVERSYASCIITRLRLSTCPLLNKITIEKGVMSNLQSLWLDNCPELNTMPQGLQYLTKLKLLALEHVSKELKDSIRGGGMDREKVQHIPEIYHYYQTPLGMCHESLS